GQVTQGQLDGLRLRPHPVTVHDRLDVGVLDLDVRADLAHTPTIHQTCMLRVPRGWPTRGHPRRALPQPPGSSPKSLWRRYQAREMGKPGPRGAGWYIASSITRRAVDGFP